MSAASVLTDAGLALGAGAFVIATFALVTGIWRGLAVPKPAWIPAGRSPGQGSR